MTFQADRRVPPPEGQGVGRQIEPPAARSSAQARSAAADKPIAPRPGRWIVLVAKGQDELYEHLRHAFSTDRQVEVVVDRRNGLHRNPCWIIDRLRTHGVAVIRRESPDLGVA